VLRDGRIVVARNNDHLQLIKVGVGR